MSQTCLQMSRDISFLVGKIHNLWKKDGATFCSLDPKKEPSSHIASIFVNMYALAYILVRIYYVYIPRRARAANVTMSCEI